MMAVVLIPALDPDARLARLVAELGPERGVVVDDGSGPASRDVLEQVRALGATVLHHGRNRGKGAALRTGIAHTRSARPGIDVVTADCDGQHRPDDVAAVEAALRASAGRIVLGERRFTGDVPLRSRVGNRVARRLFALASGVAVQDAQTGLRGLPSATLPWIVAVPGDRFEHEQRVLLEAARRGIGIEGVPIATVYLDGNASSHFRPVADSVRVLAPVLAPLLRALAVGLACFALDAALVVVLATTLSAVVAGSAALAAVVARTVSAGAHFALSRRWVFRSRGPVGPQLRSYVALALAVVLVGAGLLQLAVSAGAPILLAKLAIDLALAALVFVVQRFLVFAAAGRPPRAAVHALTTDPRPAGRA